ncbi:hypothetical protein NHG25_02550 [Aerococcaceae bacterium NML191292]|nr:hypothetical protein [Aerococcaceae bacterium NML191292]
MKKTINIIFVMLFSASICIDIHELGHCLFGKFLRFNIQLIEFCFFQVSREEGIWNFRRKHHRDFFAGKVFFDIESFEELEKINSLKLSLFSLGGTISSGIFCYLSFVYLHFPYANLIKVIGIIILIFSIIGDGVTSVMLLFSRSYRIALLLIIYMRKDECKSFDVQELAFLEKEMNYLNDKELRMYDCLAISIFSQFSIQYNLKTLNINVLEYYVQKLEKGKLFNFFGNVGLGFGKAEKNAVRNYLLILTGMQ